LLRVLQRWSQALYYIRIDKNNREQKTEHSAHWKKCEKMRFL
jgi:hypothetical protein